MKFFRKKDKLRNGSNSGPSWMPGFGSSGSSTGNHGHLAPARGYGPGDSWPDGSRSFFGSPPASGIHGARADSQFNHFNPRPTRASAATLSRLPAAILERIFTFVCPQSRDESYSTCEQSAVEDGCMLCDLRDLAHCVAVCRRWRDEGVKLLYHSIRIDSVHYCELEAVLAERRKRRSRFDRNGQPDDPAQARLKLLCRTLREDPVRRGRLVQFLKMPYMLRESCQADLARTIAVTPSLRYVDLPEGLFSDEPSFLTLRLEVQARCLDLRKMTYMAGSENSLQALATGRVWTRLEVLELIRIDMEPIMLRQALSCLGNLRALKINQTAAINDETLAWNESMPPFPPLEEFILTDIPSVTAEGLKAWLVLPEARQTLRVLTLNRTGVRPWALQEVLAYAPRLKHLSILDAVTASLSSAAGSYNNIPPLSSVSLESLHFEITAAPSTPKYSNVTSSYYNYLANSLLSGGLPNLRAVYVRDPNFPDLLLGLPPPAPAYAEGGVARPASSGSASPYSKSLYAGSPPHMSNNHNNPFTPHHRPAGSLSSLNGLPLPPFNPATNPRFSSNNPFATASSSAFLSPAPPPFTGQPGGFLNLPAKLEVFTKGDDDSLGWSFVRVGGGGRRPAEEDGAGGRRRPLSSYGLAAADVMGGSTAGWSTGAGARRSVLVAGAGAGGGFLAVPGQTGGASAGGGGGRSWRGESWAGGGGGGGDDGGGESEWPRPRSSAGEKKRERLDLWR